MKKKKITAIMAVIMMAAGLSACSQSNAKLEGKSGIVKDEASKTEGDTGVVDQAPATYVQDADRKSTRLNSSHQPQSRMPSSA